jgi:hypothetical protein
MKTNASYKDMSTSTEGCPFDTSCLLRSKILTLGNLELLLSVANAFKVKIVRSICLNTINADHG